MKIVVTGSNGFIAKNLCVHLREAQHEVFEINRETDTADVLSYLQTSDFVFHLAGINRPVNSSEFETGNVDLTKYIVDVLTAADRGTPLVLTSSTQVESGNDYGTSKLDAEKIVQSYSSITGAAIYIYRLPNVFGKWCRPNYNSFVATFCNNVVRGADNSIHDPDAAVRLVYIDDVCASMIKLLEDEVIPGFQEIPVEFNTTVGEVSNIVLSFKTTRSTLITERVGLGLERALYATYLSYISPEAFSFGIPSYTDERGVFCEMLKTKDSGQFSFFTAHPGVTRGGHYHHTKSEKFLVIRGKAVFKFEHITTGRRHEIKVDSSKPEIVETIPGWTHDITNCGDEEMIVMLWANEIFDRQHPDTIAKELF